MISTIQESINQRLKDAGVDVEEINYKDLIAGTLNLRRPAVNVTINTASFEKIAQNYAYKAKLIVSLLIVFSHKRGGPTGEALRKEGTYNIIEALVNALMLEDFGYLENPLIPQSFRNITTKEYAMAGYQLYQMNFWCSYIFTKIPGDTDYGTLQALLAQYYLEPRGYTGMAGVTGPEMSDLIDVS